MTVLIRDNFLPYPDVIRSWALQQQFRTAKQMTELYKQPTDWPGLRSENVNDLDPGYADWILSGIADLAQDWGRLSDISINSYFQLTLTEHGHSWVHQDNNVAMAGVLYLTPDPPAMTGTTLYRCRDPEQWHSHTGDQAGFEFLKTINPVDNAHSYTTLFEPVDHIGNQYNRLILYPGSVFHRSTGYFGHDLRSGRLTQVFFISQLQ